MNQRINLRPGHSEAQRQSPRCLDSDQILQRSINNGSQRLIRSPRRRTLEGIPAHLNLVWRS